MKTTDAQRILTAFVRSKKPTRILNFDTLYGALKALQDLPAGVERELVRQAYRRWVEESAWTWRVAHKVRPEHAAGLRDALAAFPSLGNAFMLAALPARDRRGATLSPEGLARFLAAARALNKVHSFTASAANRAAAERMRFVAEDPVLIAALRAAVQSRGARGRDDLLEWVWFVSILALDGSAASAKVLVQLIEHAESQADRSLLDVLARVLGDFRSDSPHVERLVTRLERVIARRTSTAPSTALAKSLGIAPGDWHVTIYLGTKNEERLPWSKDHPAAELEIHGDGSDFEVTVRSDEMTSSRFTASAAGGNDLKLARPKDLVTIKAWLDAVAAKKLKRRWRWEHAYVLTHRLRGSKKETVLRWVRGTVPS